MPVPPRHLVLLLAWLLPGLAVGETSTLRLCYEIAAMSPYMNGVNQVPESDRGLMIEELLQPAAEAAGLRLELQRQPWKRCIKQLQDNQVDGIFPSGWTAERSNWARFPGPDRDAIDAVDRRYRIWDIQYPIIVARNSQLRWDGRQFANLKHGLGAPLGYITNQQLEQMGALSRSNISLETAINMIDAGRLDGYVAEAVLADRMIAQSGLQDQLTTLELPFSQADLYVPLSRDFYASHPEQAWRFWQALGQARQRLEPQLRDSLESAPD